MRADAVYAWWWMHVELEEEEEEGFGTKNG